MAQIITKYSTSGGNSPSGLTTGELAVNILDKKLYVGGAAGTVSLSDSYVTFFNGVTGAVQGISSVNGNTGSIGISGGLGITFNVTGNTYSFKISYTTTGVPTLGYVLDTDWLMVDRTKEAYDVRRIRVLEFRNSVFTQDTPSAYIDYGTSPPANSFVLQSILDGVTANTYKVSLSDFKNSVLETIDGGTFV